MDVFENSKSIVTLGLPSPAFCGYLRYPYFCEKLADHEAVSCREVVTLTPYESSIKLSNHADAVLAITPLCDEGKGFTVCVNDLPILEGLTHLKLPYVNPLPIVLWHPYHTTIKQTSVRFHNIGYIVEYVYYRDWSKYIPSTKRYIWSPNYLIIEGGMAVTMIPP